MSNSRLEKFIYAICSMEVSDLPAPLSRIEILWNCLITGETPDFEPQSRNEQYLMAMLGLYELENLPTPMSRGEKLLYKIAMGETDLSDVPGYLSRYEELLKYLIENGGIGFKYVLYTLNQSLSTLYNTAEKPVKSAILKGQTLVNMVTDNTTNGYTLEQDGSSIKNARVNLIDGFENDIYTIIFEISNMNIVNPNGNWIVYINAQTKADSGADNTSIKSFIKNGRVSFTYKPSREQKTTNWFNICLHIDSGVGSTITIKNVVVLKGDHTQEDIPYFEGMQSVKMPVLTTTGKNLFDAEADILTYGAINYVQNAQYLILNNYNARVTLKQNNLIKVKPNSTLTLSCDSRFKVVIQEYDENDIRTMASDKGWQTNGYHTLTVGANTKKVNIYFAKQDNSNITSEEFKILKNSIQFEENSTATSYEPYKSNILTVNEPVELRGIGDVRDTLNCLTGEVTKRIGEVTLDGGENWQEYSTNSVNTYCGVIRNDVITDYKGTVYLNNKLNKLDDSDVDIEGIRINSSKRIFVRLNRDKGITDLTTFKQYLSQNPITIQYEMIAESIKTVDLTTVDQDGQSTKLKTFNDITYVEIKADNLIPSVDLEVATKINEALSTMGLQHHDISETQDQLSQTIDEQTENTDATMMATTEIYENL